MEDTEEAGHTSASDMEDEQVVAPTSRGVHLAPAPLPPLLSLPEQTRMDPSALQVGTDGTKIACKRKWNHCDIQRRKS